MPSSKILDLDRKAFNIKRKEFSSDFKMSGNIAIMELGGKTFLHIVKLIIVKIKRIEILKVTNQN